MASRSRFSLTICDLFLLHDVSLMSVLGHRLPKSCACQFVFIKQQASLINVGETVCFLLSNVPLRAIQSD